MLRARARRAAAKPARGRDRATTRRAPPCSSTCSAASRREDDERALKRARRARVPIVAVVAGPVSDERHDPVRARDRRRPGRRRRRASRSTRSRSAIARRLGEDGGAARGAACRCYAARSRPARRRASPGRTAIVGAAVFVPGADLPVLALNQLRLVLRLEQAYGLEVDPRERLPEIAATIGAGFGLRAARAASCSTSSR